MKNNLKKNLLILFGMLIIIIFIIPVFSGDKINAGNVFGVLFGAVFLTYAFCMKKLNTLIKNAWKNKLSRILIVVVAIVFLCGVTLSVVAAYKICAAATNHPTGESTVVVLGCRVKDYGPGTILSERIDTAYEYLSKNPTLKCILSGGKGPDEPISEAQAMYDELVRRGIEPERLYIEDKSSNTRENIEFSKEIIIREGLNPKITIITSEFHQYRAANMAKANNIKSYAISSETHFAFLPSYFVREVGGAVIEFIKNGRF